MDVTIKDVPEEAVEEVKNMAAVAVRRYHERVELQLSQEKVDKFNAEMTDFLTANDMLPKAVEEQPQSI